MIINHIETLRRSETIWSDVPRTCHVSTAFSGLKWRLAPSCSDLGGRNVAKRNWPKNYLS